MLNYDFLPDLRDGNAAKMCRSVLLSVGFVIVSTGCSRMVTGGAGGATGDLPENTRMVNLVWKPTMTVSDFDLAPLSLYSSVTVSFVSITDGRQDPRIIGQAFEDMKVRTTLVPIATGVNVARWCRGGLEQSCKLFSINVDNKKGTLRLELEITGLSISDDYTQTGKVSLRVNAFTASDMLLWEGNISGSSDLYTHGNETDGISECLSNTVAVTLHTLLTDQSFRDAVGKSIE